MNALPRQKLRELISRHGPALYTDAPRLEGLLRACCPPDTRKEVDLLTSALKARVAVDLRDASPSVPIEKTVVKLAKRLEAEQNVAPEMARWAVESWAVAMRKVSEADLSGGPKKLPVRLPAGAAKISNADLIPAPVASPVPGTPAAAPEAPGSASSKAPPGEPPVAKSKAGEGNPPAPAPPAAKAVTTALPASVKPVPPASKAAPAAPVGPRPAKKAVALPHPAEAKPGAFAPAPAHKVEAPLVHPAPSPIAPRRSTPRRGALSLVILVILGLLMAAGAWRFFFLENRREVEKLEGKAKRRRRKAPNP